MKTNLTKYLRPPFDVVDHVYSEEIKTIASPDNTMKLIITHCWSYKPGSNPGLFHLLDYSENIIEHFTPHTTNGHVCWSEDSRYLVLDIGENEKGILILDTLLMKVAFIPTTCRDFRLLNGDVFISVSDKLIENLNSDQLLGGGTTELPRIKYEKPKEVKISISSLPFFPKNNIAKILELTKEQEEIKLNPVENGFWEFNGKFPQNTTDGFNNRPFEMYQLETFAAYGNTQSVAWLKEIQAMNKPYKKWDKVVDYLGKRNRL